MNSTSSLPLIGKKRLRKQVRISNLQGSFPNNLDPNHNTSTTWYQPQELALFKLDARDYILGRNSASRTETRGLERYTLERSNRKKTAIRCTLLAISKGLSTEDVALVSKTCSATTRKEAFCIGFRDYCEVYHPSQVGVIPEMSSMAKPQPQLPSLKRSSCSSASLVENKRRVRARTC